MTVYPQGPITFDDPDLVIRAALKGIGVGTALEQQVERFIAHRRLTQVLQDWCPTFPGFFLYYPSRRNRPAALDALIDSLRL
jgi:DNA-binding transcriptional LysR family regulator